MIHQRGGDVGQQVANDGIDYTVEAGAFDFAAGVEGGGIAHIGFSGGVVGVAEEIANVHRIGLRAQMVDHLFHDGVDHLRPGHRGIHILCVGFVHVDHGMSNLGWLKIPFVA